MIFGKSSIKIKNKNLVKENSFYLMNTVETPFYLRKYHLSLLTN